MCLHAPPPSRFTNHHALHVQESGVTVYTSPSRPSRSVTRSTRPGPGFCTRYSVSTHPLFVSARRHSTFPPNFSAAATWRCVWVAIPPSPACPASGGASLDSRPPPPCVFAVVAPDARTRRRPGPESRVERGAAPGAGRDYFLRPDGGADFPDKLVALLPAESPLALHRAVDRVGPHGVRDASPATAAAQPAPLPLARFPGGPQTGEVRLSH
jgi:hypothetical protein